jgi:hypothetical protein
MAIENERLIPQQAVTMVTKIDDVETYIMHREAGRIYVPRFGRRLEAISFPVNLG